MAHVERPRFSCMLGGVLATLSALPKTVPIIHGAQGCGGNLANAYSLGGYLGAGYCGNAAVPSSCVGESEIIFGGTDRLQEEIVNTFDVMEGDLFVLTTTCMTDIIGDDIKGVLNKLGPTEKPVLFIDTGGFKGNSYYGYSKMMEELFKQYIPISQQKDKRLVNLMGFVPGYDPFFRGNLEELKRILNLMHVRANTFFTHDQSLGKIQAAGEAALNIVFSRLYGLEAAKAIRESHGIEYLVCDTPIGNEATVKFALKVAEKLELDAEAIQKILQKETDSYYKYVDRATDLIADSDFQYYAIVVANSTDAIPYAKYLDNEIGWIVRYVFVTDDLNDAQKKTLEEAFENTLFTVQPTLRFETDTYKIQKYVEQTDVQFKSDRYYETISPLCVLGSTIDRKLAESLGGILLGISYPLTNRIVLSKGYAGFKGGLNLLEDLIGLPIAGR